MLAESIEAFDALAQDHDLKKAAMFARMLKNHSFGILTAWKHCISTDPLGGEHESQAHQAHCLRLQEL